MYRTTRKQSFYFQQKLERKKAQHIPTRELRALLSPDWLLKKLKFPLSQSRFSLVFPVNF